MVVVRSETVRRTRNTIKGHFNLSDGSKTQFSIDKEYGWEQWGNTKENLGITVDRLDRLKNELFGV